MSRCIDVITRISKNVTSESVNIEYYLEQLQWLEQLTKKILERLPIPTPLSSSPRLNRSVSFSSEPLVVYGRQIRR